jgi:hypothetical protein
MSHWTVGYAELASLTFEMDPDLLGKHLAFDIFPTINLNNISEKGFSYLS